MDRNNDYLLLKNDHQKWQDLYSEFILSKNNFFNVIEAKKYLKMKSQKSNFKINIKTKKELYDFRAQLIGERKNGFYIYMYDEIGDIKFIFTITFKEANIDVDRLDKRIVEAITEEIRNSEYV